MTHIFNAFIIANLFEFKPTCPLVYTPGNCFVHGEAEQICCASVSFLNLRKIEPDTAFSSRFEAHALYIGQLYNCTIPSKASLCKLELYKG